MISDRCMFKFTWKKRFEYSKMTSLKLYLACFFLLSILLSSANAEESVQLKIISASGEHFSAKLLIDIKNAKKVSVNIGSSMDYKSLKVSPPSFLDSLYVNLTNLYEKGKRIAYINSKKLAKEKQFSLVIRISLDDQSILKKFDISTSGQKLKKASTPSPVAYKIKTDFSFLVAPKLEYTVRDINYGSSTASSTVTYTMLETEIMYKDSMSVFFDIGSGVLKINDGIAFNSLSLPVNLDKYDGGRSFAYGGGLKGKVYEDYDFKMFLSAEAYRFDSEADSTDIKLLNTKAEVTWTEYRANLITVYDKFKMVKPYFGLSYSEVTGDLKVSQTFVSTSSSQTKTLDEKTFIGGNVGVTAFFIEGTVFDLRVKFLTGIGIRALFGYVF